MARTAEWKSFAIAVSEWALENIGPDKLWSYIDGQRKLNDIGFTAGAIKRVPELTVLIPVGKEHQIGNRIYYLFHNASEQKPRKNCWGEWPLAIPLRSGKLEEILIAESATRGEIIPVELRDPVERFQDAIVWRVAEEQGHSCYYCRTPFDEECGPQGDHILPHSMGGRTIYSNCIAACTPCNLRRNNRPFTQFMREIRAMQSRGRGRLYANRRVA